MWQCRESQQVRYPRTDKDVRRVLLCSWKMTNYFFKKNFNATILIKVPCISQMVSQGFSSILFPLTTSDPWIYFLTNGTWTYLGFFVCLFRLLVPTAKTHESLPKTTTTKKTQNRLPSSLENSTTSWWVLRSSRSWLAAFVCFTSLTFQTPTQGPRLGTGQATDDVDADPERKTHLIRAEGGRE